jgi:hypothetical protein
LSWLEEAFFDESVSKGLLEKKADFPLWICRRPEQERKDVLLCLDGSDAAFRMADHVGFVLGQERRHSVTLLAVKKPGAALKEATESILSRGREHLMNNSFPGEMIKTRVVEAGNVAKAILREAEQGRFAAVALGRRGRDQGIFKNIFMGSVSTFLFQELEKTALWVCH